MTKNIIKLIFLFSILFIGSCQLAICIEMDIPKIVAGRATITGNIIAPENFATNGAVVHTNVLHPVSGEVVKYVGEVDSLGLFSFDIDVETDITYIYLYSTVNYNQGAMVKVINDGVTKLSLTYNSKRALTKIDSHPAMNPYDMTEYTHVLGKMLEYLNSEKPPQLYTKNTNYFLQYYQNIVNERLKVFVASDSLFSNDFKEILSKELRLIMYTPDVFEYEKRMNTNYRNHTGDKTGTPKIQKIDRTYFKFLKDFNLSDPLYLQCFTFIDFQNTLLENEILGLPMIGESDIPSWLANVKDILSDLIGFDEGPYYDILAAHSFARQFNERVQPLSEKQKENIRQYWKNGEIAKILFRKNESVVKLAQVKSPLVVHDLKSVTEDTVIDTILSKYQDKVVFIDFWATWCGPCLDAMKTFNQIKGDYLDQDIAFVYITDGSSPKKLWEEKITGIGGEHYYLTDAQWRHIMNTFDFQGIPSYALYSKEGVLIEKFTGFPGNDAVKKLLNEQLK